VKITSAVIGDKSYKIIIFSLYYKSVLFDHERRVPMTNHQLKYNEGHCVHIVSVLMHYQREIDRARGLCTNGALFSQIYGNALVRS
jgi:hypothetical protein